MTVCATLSADDAATTLWDVVIIGAGVSGSMAAREMARLGCRVLLIDKHAFPRRKVCGACLNGAALRLLSKNGMSELIRDLDGAPLNRLALRCAGKRVDLSLPAGQSISREALDTALIQAAISSGVQFLPETTATITHDDAPPSNRTVRLTQHETDSLVQARVVIIASGLAAQGLPTHGEWTTDTTTQSRIGVGCILDAAESEFPAGTIWMAVGRQGYVGLVRLEDGRLNVAAALDRDFLTDCRSPGNATSQVLHEAGLPCSPALTTADWQGTVSLTRRTSPVAHRGVFLIGDAASYVEPFTGEGMAWAMLSGLNVAPWAKRALSGWSPQVERGWTRDYQRLIQRQQRTCRLVSHLLHNPKLQILSMSLLQRCPWLARFAMSK